MAHLHKNHPTVITIRELAAKGKSQKQIAHEVNISQRSVNYWLNHEREMEMNRRRRAITVEDKTCARFNVMRKKYNIESADIMLNHLMDSYDWVSK